jgi:hypothetical protein
VRRSKNKSTHPLLAKIALFSTGPHDPGFNVHSPFKQPAGSRLARSGLAIAYGVDVGTHAPFMVVAKRSKGAKPGQAEAGDGAGDEVTLAVTNVTEGSEVRLHAQVGFEAFAGGVWHAVSIT